LDGRASVVRSLWKEFILLWKSLPELWDMTNEKYYDADLREKSYNLLLEKMKKINPQADVHFLKMTLRGFRLSFSHALPTYEQERKVNKDYKPTLWYIEDLLFLKGNCFLKNEKSPVSNKKGVLSKSFNSVFYRKVEHLKPYKETIYMEGSSTKKEFYIFIFFLI